MAAHLSPLLALALSSHVMQTGKQSEEAPDSSSATGAGETTEEDSEIGATTVPDHPPMRDDFFLHPDDADPTIREVRELASRDLDRCYERVRMHNPDAEGSMTLTVTFGEDGRVTGVETTDIGFDEVFQSCVEGKAMRWRIDANDESRTIELPLLFGADP